jgi:hypothetical protein
MMMQVALAGRFISTMVKGRRPIGEVDCKQCKGNSNFCTVGRGDLQLALRSNRIIMYELSYFFLLFVIIGALGMAFKKACDNASMDRAKTKRFLTGYVLFFGIWVAYATIVSLTGFFTVFSFPPRVALFLIIPAFATMGWFFRSKNFQDIIKAFPLAFATYFQSFRIAVELLILGLYLRKLGPIETTFEGYNFDILCGLTAPIVGWLVLNVKLVPRKFLIVWNIACMLVLANIVIIFNTLILKPELWGYSSSPIAKEFATAPYLYIAAVYMPVAVFLHIMSLKKLLAERKEASLHFAAVRS